MKDSAPASSGAPSSGPDELLRHLPPAAGAAFRRYQSMGDVGALDPVVFAIVEDYMPRKNERPLAELPPETRLIDDLGFDSLAITELVFFTEELFGISIANDEILQVHTLADLRTFVRCKVTQRAAAA